MILNRALRTLWNPGLRRTLTTGANSPSEAAAALQVGLKNTNTYKVAKEYTTNRKRKPGADVLSSPSMIMFMELTCAEAVEPKLLPKFTTVGFHVDVKHLAPTALGQVITVNAELKEVNGTQLTFSVVAKEGDKVIGSGTHRRAVISAE